jgi:hypothetical protein
VTDHSPTKQSNREWLFTASPTWRLLVLSTLFTTALAIRVFGINETPLDFHPVKQYRFALSARAYYYDSLDSVPEWKREVASANMQQIGLLHPPILERLAAYSYLLAGEERLWIPRLLSSLFWVVGGVFVYLIARRMTSGDGAIFSTAFYLLLPFGVLASQSFQIDPLMVMMMSISLFLIIRYRELPSVGRLLGAAIASGTAILLKPVCFPVIGGVFAALAIDRQGVRKSVLNPHSLTFTIIALLPTVVFYGYGIIAGGVLEHQAEKSFIPTLFLEFRFWDGWLKRVRIVMGYTYFLGGLLGTLVFRRGWPKAFVLGLWAGYFAMCFLFNYTICTHDYYHLPLVPIVALSLGPIASLILERVNRETRSWYWRLTVWAVLFVILFLSAGTSVQARRKLPDFENDVHMAQSIGDEVAHSTRTIVLDPYEGKPLMYYGEFSGEWWPYWYDIRDEKLWGQREMSVEERLNLLSLNNSPECFIITDLVEFEGQEDLQEFLTTRFSILVERDEYLIFDLRTSVNLEE